MPTPSSVAKARQDSLRLGAKDVLLRFVRRASARRYILRVLPDGSARVTIPWGGSQQEAVHFAERNLAWIERQLRHQEATSTHGVWRPGDEILFRGAKTALIIQAKPDSLCLSFGDQTLELPREVSTANLRPIVEAHMRRLAEMELVERTRQLAAVCGLAVRKITVRDQRSRWGSCSQKGCISLNWRLVQTPPFVRDYIIYHELMHLMEMNHSAAFWTCVKTVCPYYEQAEHWLKRCGRILHG